MFRCQDGTIVDYGSLIELLYFRSWIRRFQIVQHDYDRFEFVIERSESGKIESKELEEIRSGVTEAMGRSCLVEFSWVSEIARSGSGKYRFTISHVH